MAGQQKAIFLRFNMEDEADSSLYMKLAEAAGSVSLTSYVKRVLEEYLSIQIEMAERQQFHEHMLVTVREEIQEQGMKLVGALLAGIGTVTVQKIPEKSMPEEAGLPEACGMEKRQESYENILSEMGIKYRMNRSIQVEGAFGVLKNDYEFQRFLLRGKTKVKLEILLLCMGYNINKLHARIQNERTESHLFPVKETA